MNANKQLVNLAGILAVVVVLVAGIALIAFPMYSESRAIDDQTRTVTTNNTIYEQQVAILTEAGSRIEQIDADVAALRAQIASDTQLDDIHALIAAAAEDLDIRVVSVAVDDEEPWIPRTQVDEDGNVIEDAAAPEAAATTDASAEGAAGDADAAASDDAAAPAPTVPEEAGASPQQQALVTITLDLALPFEIEESEGTAGADAESDDAEGAEEVSSEERAARARTASAFVDALGRGPRLILPINVAYTDGKLVVSANTFFRTEDTP